jgi:hypothetical protein
VALIGIVMQIWILTFERPRSLNRLIHNIGNQGGICNIWSNGPNVIIDDENKQFVDEIIINPVNTIESTSWCARSWNSIYIKGFHKDDEIAAIQDDTDVSPSFMHWINTNKQKFDFIWGPSGDQFHFIKKKVLQKVGWWDERYNGCFCADADYLKRVFSEYDKNLVSVEEGHGWGFQHNHCDIRSAITPFDFGRYNNGVDTDYLNQFHAYGNIEKTHRTLYAARKHFSDKWGTELLDHASVVNEYNRKLEEIDWYPWASRKFGIEIFKD